MKTSHALSWLLVLSLASGCFLGSKSRREEVASLYMREFDEKTLLMSRFEALTNLARTVQEADLDRDKERVDSSYQRELEKRRRILIAEIKPRYEYAERNGLLASACTYGAMLSTLTRRDKEHYSLIELGTKVPPAKATPAERARHLIARTTLHLAPKVEVAVSGSALGSPSTHTAGMGATVDHAGLGLHTDADRKSFDQIALGPDGAGSIRIEVGNYEIANVRSARGLATRSTGRDLSPQYVEWQRKRAPFSQAVTARHQRLESLRECSTPSTTRTKVRNRQVDVRNPATRTWYKKVVTERITTTTRGRTRCYVPPQHKAEYARLNQEILALERESHQKIGSAPPKHAVTFEIEIAEADIRRPIRFFLNGELAVEDAYESTYRTKYKTKEVPLFAVERDQWKSFKLAADRIVEEVLSDYKKLRYDALVSSWRPRWSEAQAKEEAGMLGYLLGSQELPGPRVWLPRKR